MTKRAPIAAIGASRKAGGHALEAIAGQIKALEKKNIANVVEIRRLLEQADEACEHGAYMVWLKAEFGWSHQTSLRYRSVYNLSQNPQIVDFTKFDISISALYLLAELNLADSKAKAIIAPAKVGRVRWPAKEENVKCLRRIRNRNGRCYELTVKVMMEEPGAEHFKLVHGRTNFYRNRGEILPLHKHAWIELADGTIYDVVGDAYMTMEEYVTCNGAVEIDDRYTHPEVMIMLAKTGYCGPWRKFVLPPRRRRVFEETRR